MFQAQQWNMGSSQAPAPRRGTKMLSVMSTGPLVFKQRAVQEAENQQRVIDDKLRKLDLAEPGYQFKELIGKGAYGRVYKSVQQASGRIVAVKVLETDAMDFDAEGPNKDTGMEDALKEINVLQRLQQSKATNVNLFYEAFQVHSQLWIVSEYCPGGSVTTLRRATNNKLEERYIIPIARELAKGLKSVHDAGIVHRDIKCSNVMISEDGRVQIIDFGVAAVLLSNLEDDKRKTVIGTPHWMAPEMQKNMSEIAHGTEVDCWAYGITLYECAMGAPPNARTMPGRELKSKIRQAPPRLPDDRFSGELRELVAFVLEPDPKKRPKMADVCEQDYLTESEEKYPTSSLAELVQLYYMWEHSGGARASLFMEGGAAKPQAAPDGGDEEEDWNFSTTANFEKVQQKEIIRLSMLDPNTPLDPALSEMLANSPPTDMDDDDEPFDQHTARYGDEFDDLSGGPGSAEVMHSRGKGSKGQVDQHHEARVARGARAMQGLFDDSVEPYKYSYGPSSDLPLRSGEGGDSMHRKELSVSSNSSAGNAPNIDLNKVPKGRTNRATMQWKWDENLGENGGMMPPPPPPDGSAGYTMASTPVATPPRPKLQHSATEPMVSDRPMSETLDLDAMMGEASFTLNRTNTGGASQYNTGTTSSMAASSAATLVHGGPDTDDDDGMIDLDIGDTMKPGYYAMTSTSTLGGGTGSSVHSRAPSHAKQESSSSSLSRPPTSLSTTFAGAGQYPPRSATLAGSLYAPPGAAPPHLRAAAPGSAFPWPQTVNPTVLLEGTPAEAVQEALEGGLHNWLDGLEALMRKLDEFNDDDDEDDGAQASPMAGGGAAFDDTDPARKGSAGSMGFGGPGDDVGEHIPEHENGAGLGDDGHEADGEGDAAAAGYVH